MLNTENPWCSQCIECDMHKEQMHDVRICTGHKKMEEKIKPLVSGHGSSRGFHCGLCRKFMCDWYDAKHNPPDKCRHCGTLIDWCKEE